MYPRTSGAPSDLTYQAAGTPLTSPRGSPRTDGARTLPGSEGGWRPSGEETSPVTPSATPATAVASALHRDHSPRGGGAGDGGGGGAGGETWGRGRNLIDDILRHHTQLAESALPHGASHASTPALTPPPARPHQALPPSYTPPHHGARAASHGAGGSAYWAGGQGGSGGSGREQHLTQRSHQGPPSYRSPHSPPPHQERPASLPTSAPAHHGRPPSQPCLTPPLNSRLFHTPPHTKSGPGFAPGGGTFAVPGAGSPHVPPRYFSNNFPSLDMSPGRIGMGPGGGGISWSGLRSAAFRS